MQEDITNVLTSCAMPKSNEDRLQNEKKIRAYKDQQPEEFVYVMAQQLNNNTIHEAARQLAGVLFKNSVKKEDPEPFWFSLSQETRENLKNLILEPLADSSKLVRLSACS